MLTYQMLKPNCGSVRIILCVKCHRTFDGSFFFKLKIQEALCIGNHNYLVFFFSKYYEVLHQARFFSLCFDSQMQRNEEYRKLNTCLNQPTMRMINYNLNVQDEQM